MRANSPGSCWPATDTWKPFWKAWAGILEVYAGKIVYANSAAYFPARSAPAETADRLSADLFTGNVRARICESFRCGAGAAG